MDTALFSDHTSTSMTLPWSAWRPRVPQLSLAPRGDLARRSWRAAPGLRSPRRPWRPACPGGRAARRWPAPCHRFSVWFQPPLHVPEGAVNTTMHIAHATMARGTGAGAAATVPVALEAVQQLYNIVPNMTQFIRIPSTVIDCREGHNMHSYTRVVQACTGLHSKYSVYSVQHCTTCRFVTPSSPRWACR